MAKLGINKVTLLGNVGQAPEVRVLSSGNPVANFSVATSESWRDKVSGEIKEQTEWHRLICYRKLAEIVSKYVKKGSKIYIEGRLRTRKWEDQTGHERSTTEIHVDDLILLDKRPKGEEEDEVSLQSQRTRASESKGSVGSKEKSAFLGPAQDELDDEFDDDIPF